jgi:DNA-binding transcriptional MocR family regulator
MARQQFETWAREKGRDKDLNPPARHVLMVLATHANNVTGWAYVSVRTLVDETGWDRATIFRAFAAIDAAGILEVERRPGHSTRWRFPQLGETDGDPSHCATHVDNDPSHSATGGFERCDGGGRTVRHITPYLTPYLTPSLADELRDELEGDSARAVGLATWRAALAGSGP